MSVRWDDKGMFWEDQHTAGRSTVVRMMPPIPNTGWKTPSEFPRLEAASELAIDLETYDPNMMDLGPGDARGDGHIVGIAVGVPEGDRWYFPMRHKVGGGNLDPVQVLKWAKAELTRAKQPKIGANLMYDIGWLRAEGIKMPRETPLIDIQFAEALLDEHHRSYSLDNIAVSYFNEHKISTELYDWCARAYGGPVNEKQRANIYRAPVSLVGPYAEGDVDLPLRIWALQEKEINSQGLFDLFLLECQLIPLLIDMRFKGVKVNIPRAEKAATKLRAQEKQIAKKIYDLVGFEVNVNANDSLAKAFDSRGQTYPRTEKGAPSFRKEWLAIQPDELSQLVILKRKLAKTAGTFIESYILEKHHNGIIHAQFHPLRSDDYGTVSGRFSSSHPNLQNPPARDPEIKKIVRGIFEPHEGRWRRYDYSQIEYRLLAHYAVGPGAEEIRKAYRRDPKINYHKKTQQLILDITGLKTKYKDTKNTNFGLTYGMAETTMQTRLQLSDEESKELFKAYHEAVPFTKETFRAVSNRANNRGYIKTILGRRARFPNFEERYGRRQRARIHKALNSLLQGGCADIIKKAMRDCYHSGLYDEVGVPMIQVHDELNHSDAGNRDAFTEIKRIMETCVNLKVPLLVECEIGTNWGNCK